MKPASFWKTTSSGRFVCGLCVRHCSLAPGETGFCGLRTARDELHTAAYGRVAALAVDPIEKKPLFHATPGAPILSFAVAGCNLACPWCQNHAISQWPRLQGTSVLPGRPCMPQELVDMAIQAGCAWIAATYTEPTVFFEYALDVARLARQAGLRNAWVTNGTMSTGALRELLPFLDAANVDLKTCDNPAGDALLGVSSACVRKNIETMLEAGVLVEITTLLVPGFNDAPEPIRSIARFVSSLGERGIWHVSRYHPCHEWTAPPTPASTLRLALDIADEMGIPFVYTGNLASGSREETRCPACREILVRRSGYRVLTNALSPAGACPYCGHRIPGIWA